MSESTYQALPQCPQLQTSNVVLSSPGGKLKCKGLFTANVTLKENTYSEDIYIIECPCVDNLLSRQAACRMGLVQRVNETTADVYGDIGLMDCDVEKN